MRAVTASLLLLVACAAAPTSTTTTTPPRRTDTSASTDTASTTTDTARRPIPEPVAQGCACYGTGGTLSVVFLWPLALYGGGLRRREESAATRA